MIPVAIHARRFPPTAIISMLARTLFTAAIFGGTNPPQSLSRARRGSTVASSLDGLPAGTRQGKAGKALGCGRYFASFGRRPPLAAIPWLMISRRCCVPWRCCFHYGGVSIRVRWFCGILIGHRERFAGTGARSARRFSNGTLLLRLIAGRHIGEGALFKPLRASPLGVDGPLQSGIGLYHRWPMAMGFSRICRGRLYLGSSSTQNRLQRFEGGCETKIQGFCGINPAGESVSHRPARNIGRQISVARLSLIGVLPGAGGTFARLPGG